MPRPSWFPLTGIIGACVVLPFFGALPSHAGLGQCERLFEDEIVLPELGPYRQPLLQRKIGGTSLYGMKTAVQHADGRTASAAKVMTTLSGTSTDTILVASGLSGSLARIELYERASDLDFEAVLVTRLKKAGFDVLSDPKSDAIKGIARYLQEHVETVLRENATYRFIELKAGEFIDPATGETKGIKWNLKDIRRGSMTVEDARGSRLVTLEDVLAEDAIIKVDWAIPSLQENPIASSYTEATVLYRLGGKVGNSQARMRHSENGSGRTLPLRATSLAMEEQDLNTMREASIAADSVPREEVHQYFVHSFAKYLEINHLKILKRVFSLSQFWEDLGAYNRLHHTDVTPEQLQRDFQKVLTDPELLDLSQLRAGVELLQILDTKQIALPAGVRTNWLKEIRTRFEVKGSNFEEMAADLTERIHVRIAKLEEKTPLVRDFTDWVLKRMQFAEGELSPSPLFLAFKPDKNFERALARRLDEWRVKYPHLDFVSPQDLHMTVRFLGRLPSGAADKLSEETKGIGDGMTFRDGGAFIFGRNFQVISILFTPQARFESVQKLISAKASAYGAVKDGFQASEFRPHITIANIDLRSREGRVEADRFLREEDLEEFTEVVVSGMRIWTNSKTTDGEKYELYASPAEK